MNAVRALETLRALDRPMIRTEQAAAVLGVSGSSASHLLASLQATGSVLRISPGRWSTTASPDPSLVASWLTDPYPSYVSLYTAMARHGLITQIPRTIYVVSTADTKTVKTPVGTFSVHRLPPRLFGGYTDQSGVRLATAEKAVFDTLYLARARGQRFSHLTEVELPASFRADVLEEWAARIVDARVRVFVHSRIDALLARRPADSLPVKKTPREGTDRRH